MRSASNLEGISYLETGNLNMESEVMTYRSDAAPGAARPTTHVLIIEDNPDTCTSLQAILELEGYKVETACDGVEGVEKALASRPAIALVDIGLPRCNGFDVARQLRASLGSNILLIACTAYSQAEDHQQALDAGFDALRVKPIDPDQLLKWLRALGPSA